jgi:hypothetical protein
VTEWLRTASAFLLLCICCASAVHLLCICCASAVHLLCTSEYRGAGTHYELQEQSHWHSSHTGNKGRQQVRQSPTWAHVANVTAMLM